MRGFYRIYLDNEVVAEFDNLITDNGKKAIGRFLSGQQSFWADSIAIGSGSSSPQQSDDSLDMEFWREGIDLRVYSADENEILVRSIIPASVVGKIHEIGIYAAPGNDSLSSGPVVVFFDSSEEAWTGGTVNTTNNRIGQSALSVSASAQGSPISLDTDSDFRAFTSEDIFKLAYSAAAGVTQVAVKLKASNTDFREYTFAPSSPGYSVESWNIQDFSVVGNPQWSEVYEIEVIAFGSGSITYDALAVVKDPEVDQRRSLVSRALVSFNGENFFSKKPQRELQIEYGLELGV